MSKRRALKAAITVTNTAAGRIAQLLKRRPDATGVRLGVRARGCNGLSYTLDYVDNAGFVFPASAKPGAPPAASTTTPASAAAAAASQASSSSSSPAVAAAAAAVQLKKAARNAPKPVSTMLDEQVEMDGVRVYIDPKALFYVVGTTMDFVVDDLSSQFVFSNPNQQGECGCGESFSIDTKPLKGVPAKKQQTS
jgi:iron-sulfur cluster assembly accessory protein